MCIRDRVLAISDLIAGHIDRALMVCGHLLKVEPVSYTHLDVYKRQIDD